MQFVASPHYFEDCGVLFFPANEVSTLPVLYRDFPPPLLYSLHECKLTIRFADCVKPFEDTPANEVIIGRRT